MTVSRLYFIRFACFLNNLYEFRDDLSSELEYIPKVCEMIPVIELSISDDEVQPLLVGPSCPVIELLSSDDDEHGLVHSMDMVEYFERRDLILPEIVNYEIPPLKTDTKNSEGPVAVNDTLIIWPKSSSNTKYTSDNSSNFSASLSQPSKIKEGVRLAYELRRAPRHVRMMTI